MENAILKALFFIRKNQILQLYKTNSEGFHISDSFAFAIAKDCYPYFQSDDETELYKDCFSIKRDFIENVITYIDEAWKNKKYYTFYELEDKFGHENRYNLLVIIRYCFLNGTFCEKEFQSKMEENCPDEAHGLFACLREWEI